MRVQNRPTCDDNPDMTDNSIITRIRCDERGMIVGWLGKLAIGFVLLAVVVFDGGSILVNFFTLDSTANEIAVKVTTDATTGTTLRESTLTEEAKVLAKESGAHLVELRLEGNIVYVTLRRRADTLVIGRISPIADWARATAEGQSGTG